MENLYLKNLDVKINKGEIVGIIGGSGAGKTLLLKKIIGRVNNNDIYLDGKSFNEYDIDFKKKNIVCIFSDNLYNTDNVRDELSFYLYKLNLKNKDCVDEFMRYFSLEEIIDSYFQNLDTENRVYIKILSLLIIKPSIVCIDDLLTYLSLDKKKKIINYIREHEIILLNVTSDMEELLFFDKVLVLNKGKKVIYDDLKIVLKNEDIFKDNGLVLPFIYELNNLLKSYELIDNEHLVYKELVDILWK